MSNIPNYAQLHTIKQYTYRTAHNKYMHRASARSLVELRRRSKDNMGLNIGCALGSWIRERIRLAYSNQPSLL
jgi:hypothetical protein